MSTLQNIRPELRELINNLSEIVNIEMAIFDEEAHLLACTEVYLENKGESVHSNSIEEALLQENVIVNKPGYMNSCIGCRFNNNCPSKIEILNRIQLDNSPIGVLSFTSFSEEGHKRISSNTLAYLKLLKQTSNLISSFAISKNYNYKYTIMEKTINKLIQISDKNIIITNDKGNITYCNPPIDQISSFCDLYTRSIYQILPNNISKEIIDGKKINRKCRIDDTSSNTITSYPIKNSDTILGHIIEIKNNKNTKQKNINKPFLDNIITKDKNIIALKRKIKKVSNSTSSVIISGETGTGKELFAKGIHYSSDKKNEPFIPINCANIPDNLFESELFGYEEGAFTGAKKGGKLGYFQLANNGTLFLDEIAELPIHQQSKLLRVLQDHVILPVGSTELIPIDVRIIAATNKNLEEMLEKGSFREDLYYRLNVIPINIPPLRERKKDIEILTYHFLEKYCIKLQKNFTKISNDVIEKFYEYNWPGNIRELENIIEYAVNMEESDYITLDSLPKKLLDHKNMKVKDKINYIELNMIQSLLNKNGWDMNGKEKTADELGISLRTLYRRIKELEDI